MSRPAPDQDPSPEDVVPEDPAARKRRLAAVFGEVLPEQTADDRDPEGAEPGGDDWLRRQVPPHHG